MARLASLFVALGFAMIIPRGSEAQDQVQVVGFNGTRDEQTQIQTIIKRVKDRFAADATIVTRLEAAYKLKDYAGMRKIFAAVAQVSADQVSIGDTGRLSLREPSRPTFRFASMGRFNPFWIIFGTGKGRVYCLGLGATGKEECHKALIEAGYTPLT